MTETFAFDKPTAPNFRIVGNPYLGITSGSPVIREELVAGTADRFRYADHITVEVRSSIVNVSQIAFNSPSSDCGTSGATISASTLRSGVLWSSQSATRPQAG